MAPLGSNVTGGTVFPTARPPRETRNHSENGLNNLCDQDGHSRV